jgi:hypothetical protein
MAKRTAALDLGHQICLSTASKGKLMMDGKCVMWMCENWENWKRFRLWTKNQWRYGTVDTRTPLSRSNRLRNTLIRDVNDNWEILHKGIRKNRKWDMFLIMKKEQRTEMEDREE